MPTSTPLPTDTPTPAPTVMPSPTPDWVQLVLRGRQPNPATLTAIRTASPSPNVTPTPRPSTSPSPARPAPSATPATPPMPISELHVRLKSPSGERVSFSKAEFFMEAWTDMDILQLETDQDLLVLSQETSWLQPDWLEMLHLVGNPHDYILYLEAEGYAPVQSKPFQLFDLPPNARDALTQTVVEFASGATATVSRGTVQELDLYLRKPGERRLRFVDDDLHPLPGVGVGAYMFWSDENHCGYPAASALLGQGVSDSRGVVTVPDGDFVYWLEFRKPYYRLQVFSYAPGVGLPRAARLMSLVTYLSEEETVVGLHRLRRQSLEMLVQRDGQPVAHQDLCAESHDLICSFGDFCDPIATTDADGRIFIDEFYPELWRNLFFLGDAGVLWEADPEDLEPGASITVELP